MPSPRDLSLLLLLLLMEVLGGFAVIVGTGLLDRAALPQSIFWLLMLAGLLGIMIAAIDAAGHFPERVRRLILFAVGVVAAGASARLLTDHVSSALIAVAIVGIAYWRGIVVTVEQPSYEDVQHRFGVGFALLFLGIVSVVARGIFFRKSIWELMALLGIAYTMTAMLALATARFERTREPGAAQAVFLGVGLQLGFLLVLSLGALEFFSVDIGGWLGGLLQPVWNVLGLVVVAVLGFVLAPVFGLAEIVRTHVHVSSVRPHRFRLPFHRAPHALQVAHHPAKFPFDPRLLLILLGISLAAIVMWRVLPNASRARVRQEEEEEGGAPWSFAAFWNGLRAWIRSLFAGTGAVVGTAFETTRRRILGPSYPADPVRRLYAQLLRRAEVRGVPRAAATTPVEFQRQLSAQWPQGSAEIAALTEAYVLRRYAGKELPAEQIEGLRACWHRLRAVMQVPR